MHVFTLTLLWRRSHLVKYSICWIRRNVHFSSDPKQISYLWQYYTIIIIDNYYVNLYNNIFYIIIILQCRKAMFTLLTWFICLKICQVVTSVLPLLVYSMSSQVEICTQLPSSWSLMVLFSHQVIPTLTGFKPRCTFNVETGRFVQSWAPSTISFEHIGL